MAIQATLVNRLLFKRIPPVFVPSFHPSVTHLPVAKSLQRSTRVERTKFTNKATVKSTLCTHTPLTELRGRRCINNVSPLP